jgi:hypothetical protein
MSSYNQHQKRKNTVADTIVGYCVINASDTKIATLSDGVDDAGAPYSMPNSATGARIEIEFTSPSNEMRVVTASGFDPDVNLKNGEAIFENKTVLLLGKTSNTNFDPSELVNFKAAIKSGCTAKLQVTFYRNA